VQQAALQALETTRAQGNTAGLVVLATGLGKTWLSAFDSNRPEYRRVLFVAHREEILSQAMKTYRQIRPEARIGHYAGEQKDLRADILFASIQTLGRTAHLDRFSPAEFDYVVVDEFHHAAARTYRRLIQYFRPKFLLGLTATPERTDGGDLLALCQENLVYRCDLVEGIRRQLLCRFRYFGVPDEVDYTNIPWRNSRFDEDVLTRHVATRSRAENAFQQLQKRGGTRTITFCASQRHADFMAQFFRDCGLRANAVHSGTTSAPRAASLEELSAGRLDIICAVDVFNEGLDLPELDTILMLRPTESRILWLQQFGRGLRKTVDDKVLTVVDYIGNHRTFLLKPQTLFNLGPGDHEVFNLLERARQGPIEIAPGCFVTYELETIDVLRGLLRTTREPEQALRRYYEDFREVHGARPTAVEAYHDGYNPRSVRRQGQSWHSFIGAMGDLSADQARVVERHRSFLEALETTEMTRSYKMLVLLAMLNHDAFPGSIAINELTEGTLQGASRNAHLKSELSAGGDDPTATRGLLERNPIEAWTGGRGTGGLPYFSYRDGVFSTAFEVDAADRLSLQELTRELVEWRLAEYLQRLEARSESSAVICSVKHAGGRPIIFLPRREDHPELPEGTATLLANGEAYEAEFAKIAINVIRRPGQAGNELPAVLRGWFGADAGLPGTAHSVVLEPQGDGKWILRPIGLQTGALQKWRRYSREEIPPLFGLPFSDAIWNAGFVTRPGHIFLLVTLDKTTKAESFQYRDKFLSPTVFQWESQNRTRQQDAAGQAIRAHSERAIAVHLFVRRSSKIGQRSAPFIYCGDVQFRDWEGERPITVRWELAEGVPDRLREELHVPRSAGDPTS
jgi:superfamily II DNA or RNA helicase